MSISSLDQMLLPRYEVPDGKDRRVTICEELCPGRDHGRRYKEDGPRYQERLQYELSVVRQVVILHLLLIVWDFVSYAKKNRIPVGPGRGSGAGSIVSYVLAITDICPVKYGLLFD